MNKLEKVARAIMLARDNGGCQVVDWTREESENPHVAQAMRQARAVLAAIREPDAKMVRAADLDAEEWDIARAYRAMIDAILEGESK